MIRHREALVVLAVITFLAVSLPVSATEPEKLDIPTFAVTLADASGTPKDSFSPRTPPFFDISFALALSSSKRYATRITLIHDTGGEGQETILFEGALAEGFYRLLAPAPAGLGDVSAKIILKTRVFSKKYSGESYYVYRIWEGSYRIGK